MSTLIFKSRFFFIYRLGFQPQKTIWVLVPLRSVGTDTFLEFKYHFEGNTESDAELGPQAGAAKERKARSFVDNFVVAEFRDVNREDGVAGVIKKNECGILRWFVRWGICWSSISTTDVIENLVNVPSFSDFPQFPQFREFVGIIGPTCHQYPWNLIYWNERRIV